MPSSPNSGYYRTQAPTSHSGMPFHMGALTHGCPPQPAQWQPLQSSPLCGHPSPHFQVSIQHVSHLSYGCPHCLTWTLTLTQRCLPHPNKVIILCQATLHREDLLTQLEPQNPGPLCLLQGHLAYLTHTVAPGCPTWVWHHHWAALLHRLPLAHCQHHLPA